MKWPAIFQHFRKIRGCLPLRSLSHALGQRTRFLRVIAFDCTAEQVDLLISAGVDDEVHETSLDLRPLAAHLTRQTMGVLLKSLMEDTDNNEPPVATRPRLVRKSVAVMASPITCAGRSRRPTTGRMRQPLVRGGNASQISSAVFWPSTDSALRESFLSPLSAALKATTKLDFPLP